MHAGAVIAFVNPAFPAAITTDMLLKVALLIMLEKVEYSESQ